LSPGSRRIRNSRWHCRGSRKNCGPSRTFFSEIKENRTRRERLRELYFRVRDEEFRKQLIAKYREREKPYAELLAARFLQRTGSAQNSTFQGGIIFLALGFHFFGQVGALSGLLVGYFNGRRMEDEAFRERETAMWTLSGIGSRAVLETRPQIIRNCCHDGEAVTGEPDRASRLRVV